MSFFLPDLIAPPNRRKTWRLILAIAILAALVFGAGPAWSKIHYLRGRKLAAESEALAAQRRWPEALTKAERALRFAPGQPRALRAAAQALSAHNRIEAISYWQQLCRAGAPSAADRQQFAETALRFGNVDLAQAQIEMVLKDPGISLETARLAAAIYEQKGDRLKTVQFAREVLMREPDDPSFVLGKLLLASASREEMLAGQVLLKQLAGSGTGTALEAIRLLAGRGALNAGEAEFYIHELERSPFRLRGDQFTIAELRGVVTPYKRQQIISEMAAKPGTNLVERIGLARWLNRQKAFEKTIEVLPIEIARPSREGLLVHLDALAGLEKWREVEQLLDRDDLALEPVLVSLYKARVAKELKQPRIAALHWEQVFTLAERNSSWLQYVGEYASQNGETAQALRAYRAMIQKDPENARRAYQALVPLIEQQRDTKALRDLMHEMMLHFPDDPAVRNDLAYLNLLLNEDVEDSASAAASLVRKYPNYFSYRTTLALAKLRQGKSVEALKLYSDLKIDWTRAQPGWQAVYAAVLAANQEGDQARKMLESIDLSQLKGPESTLLAGLGPPSLGQMGQIRVAEPGNL